MVNEKIYHPKPGWGSLFLFLAVLIGGPILLIVMAANAATEGMSIMFGVMVPFCLLTGIIGLCGCMPVAPNQARVLLLFGEYKGSVKESGFYWVNPFFSKKKVSLRVRNFETGSTTTQEQKNAQGIVTQAKSRSAGRPSKVNDRDGIPLIFRQSLCGRWSRPPRHCSKWTTMKITLQSKVNRRYETSQVVTRMTAKITIFHSAVTRTKCASSFVRTSKND